LIHFYKRLIMNSLSIVLVSLFGTSSGMWNNDNFEDFLSEHILPNLTLGNKTSYPFDHWVFEDFFKPEIAEALAEEFLSFEDPRWHTYENSIEDKKTNMNWGDFPELTYKVFSSLISEGFTDLLSQRLNTKYYPDAGLHGGGWHLHGDGGNLNPHLDYDIHPKLGLQRALNLIVYISPELREEHGGHLGLYGNETDKRPGKLVKEVSPVFNRAVLFDTTQNSWHGMSRKVNTHGEQIFRKSLAVYYLRLPNNSPGLRKRALFAPREEQLGDLEVENFIKERVQVPGHFHHTDL